MSLKTSLGLRLLVSTVIGGFSGVALAQIPEVHFQRLEVAIWPEYDQPAALVMYRGWLASDVALPLTVTLPMPASVATPNAVAKRGPGTNLLVAPYTIESSGAWNLVHIQTDLPEIRLEFYVDLTIDQTRRSLTFEWPEGPEVDEVAYEVMQPVGATNFRVTPSSAPPTVGTDGLTYQRESLGSLPPGGGFFIEVSYSKASPALTVAALQPIVPPPSASAPPPQQAPAAVADVDDPASDHSVWYVVLPIVFIAGLAAGWILLSIRKEKSS